LDGFETSGQRAGDEEFSKMKRLDRDGHLLPVLKHEAESSDGRRIFMTVGDLTGLVEDEFQVRAQSEDFGAFGSPFGEIQFRFGASGQNDVPIKGLFNSYPIE
jgi:hypothetical protein